MSAEHTCSTDATLDGDGADEEFEEEEVEEDFVSAPASASTAAGGAGGDAGFASAGSNSKGVAPRLKLAVTPCGTDAAGYPPILAVPRSHLTLPTRSPLTVMTAECGSEPPLLSAAELVVPTRTPDSDKAFE